MSETGRPTEALQSYKTARAIRQKLADANPSITQYQRDLAATDVNIGLLFSNTGKPAEALRAYEPAKSIQQRLADANPSDTEVQRELALSHNNIGIILMESGKSAEAQRSYEAARAIRQKLADANPSVTLFQQDLVSTYNNIGNLLKTTNRPAEARKSFLSALAIEKKLASDHPESPDYASGLGATLNNLAGIDLDAHRFVEARDLYREAITWQKKALAANPRNPTYRRYLTEQYKNLFRAARGLHDAALAAEAQHGLAEFAASDPRRKDLDDRLAAVLKGAQPRNNAERLVLAQRAYDTKQHAAATRFWSEALAADPNLAADRKAQHRYNAACAAALAAAGEGKDDPPPDDASKAKLRGQALQWLGDERDTWTKLLDNVPKTRPLIARILQQWKEDADLASIRDSAALAKLPEPERQAWQALWADVGRLLDANGPKPVTAATPMELPADPFARP